MFDINIRYIVNDVQTAIEFYTTVLGFEVDMHPARGFACLSKDRLGLFLNQPGAGGAGNEMSDGSLPEPGGWNRVLLRVDDLESQYIRLRSEGTRFRTDIIEGKGGKQVLFEDPSGNPVELFEPRNKEVKNIKYKPEGYSTITSYLAVKDAEKLVEFLKNVFSAKEHRLLRWDDGSFMHGEYRIGDSLIMIGDVQHRHEPFPGMLYVYVPEVDAVYQKALEAGARSIEEPVDQNYGDRRGAFQDPAGNRWFIASLLNLDNQKSYKSYKSDK